jgi:3',5'-cyclic-AMP phosphodiesterase
VRKKFVWLTDTHLNIALSGATRRLTSHLLRENPDGLLITGDISNGVHIESCLSSLARALPCPIYYVLGNHDYHGRTFASVHSDLRRLQCEHPNLRWMTDSGVVDLGNGTAVIGTEGWYDARLGDPGWLRYTMDWVLIPDLFLMSGHEARIDAFRKRADASSLLISTRLEAAFESFDTVYVLTHFPPWKEATRDVGTLLEQFWLPYNTNVAMGRAIELVADSFLSKRIVVLSGHTHTDCWMRIRPNLECRVNRAKYYGRPDGVENILI